MCERACVSAISVFGQMPIVLLPISDPIKYNSSIGETSEMSARARVKIDSAGARAYGNVGIEAEAPAFYSCERRAARFARARCARR